MKKKRLLLLLFPGLVLSFIFALYLIIKTSAYLPLLEGVLERKTGISIEIGGVDISWNAKDIYIHNLRVGSEDSGGFFMSIPLLHIKGSLMGFIHRRIDLLEMERPAVYLNILSGTGGKRGMRAPPLPFQIGRATVREGMLRVRSSAGITEMRSINLALYRADTPYSMLEGGMVIPALGAAVRLKAVLDHKRPSIKELQLVAERVGFTEENPLRVGGLKVMGRFSVMLRVFMESHRKASGEIKFREVVIRGDDGRVFLEGASGTVQGGAEEMVKDRKVRYKIKARLSPVVPPVKGLHAEITGSYMIDEDSLFIRKAALVMDRYGRVALRGRVSGLRGRTPGLDLLVKTGQLDLSTMKRVYSFYGRQGRSAVVKGLLDLDGTLKGSLKEGLRWSFTSEVRDLVIERPPQMISLKGRVTGLSSEGSYQSQKDNLTLEKLNVDIDGLLDVRMKGFINKLGKGKPEVASDVEIEIKDAGSARRVFSSILPFQERLPAVEGKGRMHLRINGSLESPEVRGGVEVQGRHIKGMWYVINHYSLDAGFHFSRGSLNVDRAVLKADSVNGGNRKRSFTTRRVVVDMRDVGVSGKGSARGRLLVKTKELLMEGAEGVFVRDGDIRLSCVFYARAADRELEINSLRFDSREIKGVDARISLKLQRRGTIVKGSIEYPFSLAEGLMVRLLEGLKRKGLQIQGGGIIRSDFAFNIKKGRPPGLTIRTSLTLKDASLSSRDETIMAEGIRLQGNSSVRLDEGSDTLDMGLELTASGFEVLAGEIYGDFTKRPVSLSVRAGYDMKGKSLKIEDASLRIKGVADVSVSGGIEDILLSPLLDLKGRVSGLDLKGIYNDYLHDAYVTRYAVLEGLEVQGLTDLEFSIKGQMNSPEINTHLMVRDFSLKLDRGFYLRGVDLDLPFHIGKEDGEYRGMLKIGSASIGGARITQLRIPLLVRKESISFSRPIRVEMMGGEVVIDGIEIRRPMGPDRLLHASINMKGLDLTLLSKNFDMPVFEGELTATVPDIVFTGKSIYTDGEVIVRAFDGTIRIENLALHNIASPAMSLEADVTVDDINLSMLTKTFDTGHISGILRGYVKDLVVVNGQPQQFRAAFETVKRRGVPQIISVRALRKIQILGAGGGGSILDRGIYQFFKEYRYSKMGFRATLKNDTLLLEGFEGEGNRGYIVKGGFLPPRVDVINYTQRISFKELVERLKRIRK